MTSLLSFIITAATLSISQAAVQPLTGASIINQIHSGAAFSQMGFEVKSFPSNWMIKKPMTDEASTIEIGSDEATSKALLSFRTENVNPKVDLEKYVRQYLRDYNQYGFEVVGLQSLKQNEQNSVVVDLNQKNKATRSRQVFYKKNDKIVMATCLDDFDHFTKTIQTCNNVLNTFRWR
ncbi:MAG: hypothetical protein H7256_00725 [Bdellovibrio sp.]|nr:hypothetical protein [Bdellovibrio sp.]